jgi:signal peptidase I
VSEERYREDGIPKSRRVLRWGLRRKKRKSSFTEYMLILLVAFVLVFGFIRPFVVEAFYIPSESMVPTLEVGDRVFVNKFIYRFTEPQRGDIVVFKSVQDEEEVAEGGEESLFEGEEEELIKRVVALPRDKVAIRKGELRVNGKPLGEPYLKDQFAGNDHFGPIWVPEGYVFVMGDNRANSADSRVFGSVPIENIEGEAFVSFWPPTRVGLL